MPSVVKAFYRVLFMAVAVAPFALRDVDDFRAISERDLISVMVSGLALATHFASFFKSLKWTTGAASVTLITTQPISVGVGAAALLNERLTPRMVGGMVVALAGAFCMSIGPLVVDPLLSGGDIVAAIATTFADSSTQLYD